MRKAGAGTRCWKDSARHDRIINGVYRIDVRPTKDFPSPLTLIPSLSGPADGGRLSARASHDDTASCTCANPAESRVVYFPWDIDRTFWDVMCVDHLRLLRNAIRWACERARRRSYVEGPGLLDVTVWRQRDVDDRSPRQPDQPDDDEGPVA